MKSVQFASWLFLAILAASILLSSCRSGNKQTKSSTTVLSEAGVKQTFPLPDIPPVIASPEDRSVYLALHYWENFNFADTTLLNTADITEQGVVDYLNVLVGQNEQVVDESLQSLCSLLDSSAPARIAVPALLKKYLYEPNSPFYNEPLFARFVHFLLLQPQMRKDASYSRWVFLQKLMARNNPGQMASDFTCYNSDGKAYSLHALPRRLTLLYFYDPQCQNCYHTLLEMEASADLAAEIARGGITVLAVETEGEEEAWRNTLDRMPDTWIVTTDRGSIVKKSLYDLKALPSLYLLDADKKVLLKDAAFRDICAFLGFCR